MFTEYVDGDQLTIKHKHLNKARSMLKKIVSIFIKEVFQRN